MEQTLTKWGRPLTPAELAQRRKSGFKPGNKPKSALKTHCKHGHPITGEHAYYDARGRRHCLTCNGINGNAWDAKQRCTKETWVKVNLRNIRAKCRKRGIIFDLSPDDVEIPDACPILGIPIVLGGGLHNPNGPSIDRVVPSRGYIKGNIKVISFRANSIKRDANAAELRAIADYIDAALSISLSPQEEKQ